MPKDPLQLDAARQLACWIATLACMYQELDTLLDRGLSLCPWVLLFVWWELLQAQTKPKLLHWVMVPNLAITRDTEVEVLGTKIMSKTHH